MTWQRPLVLASASPRRTQLLGAVGVRHEVVAPGAVEPELGLMRPADHAVEAALTKGRDVARRVSGRLVLSADTVVAVGDDARDVLGKPRDRGEAADMLRRLGGRSHRVITAVALIEGGGAVRPPACRRAETIVTFRSLPESLVARYVSTDEPHDKAGAYAVQGLIATHVERLEGSWSNVVGLPLELLEPLFADLGEELAAWQDW